MFLADEEATLTISKALASVSPEQGIVFLTGDLGAGKTTFARGFLAGLGFKGSVKSPTYTIVETYHLDQKTIHHFDLYRIHDALELEAIGIRDYFQPAAICLFEWPERASAILPPADLNCYIDTVDQGRKLTLKANTGVGLHWLERFNLML